MMRTITLRGLRAHPVRFVATMLAVIVSTGFLATALILRDSVASTIEANTVAGLANVDVAVQVDPKAAEDTLLQQPIVRPSALDRVRATEGIGEADGTLNGSLAVLGGTKLRGMGYRMIAPEALNPFQVVDGRFPEATGEIAVDAETGTEIGARTGSGGSGVGASVPLATAVGEQQATVVGIVRFGEVPRRDGQPNIVVSDADAFSWLSGGTEGFSSVLATTEPDASPDTVAAAVQRELDAQPQDVRLQVLTGDAYRAQQAGDAAGIADAIGTALQIFAYVALFVGIFIVYNTFTIVVTQRQRELALLRAIGAEGRQVRRAVQLEALVVGIVASAIGYLLGIAVVFVVATAFPGLLSLGASDQVSLTLGVGGAIQVLLSGLIVTLVSSLIPAFRAARISPMEAMRSTAAEGKRASRPRVLAGLVFGVIGVLSMLAAVATKQGFMLAPGPFLLFLAAVLLGPVIISGWSTLLQRLARRGNRPTASIASANLARSPRRAATTANALVIGVFLVVFATAAGGAIRDWAVAQIESFGGADLLVGTTSAELDAGLIDEIAAVPGVNRAAPVYFGFANVEIPLAAGQDGGIGGPEAGEPLPMFLTGVSLPDDASAIDLKVEQGTLELGPNELALMGAFTDFSGLGLGDTVTVVYADGSRHDFTIGALTESNLFAIATVDTSVVREAAPDLRPANLALEVEPGQVPEVQAQVERLIEPYSTVEVLPGNAFASFFKDFFNAIISAVNGLLAIAVVVAVFGIVNTLLLAVVERTRELGLLRAVGMGRGQVRATIRIEAVLISVVGTVVGMVCGLFVAWAVTIVILADDGGGFTFPGRELALIAVLGVLVGLFASLIPAHRAAKLGILESIAYE
ncbi:MAG: FtsX-like permease family protein [Acidimicrobiales bacterium]